MISGFTSQFRGLKAAFTREVRAYFAAPIAYVFITVFLVALGLFTWEGARFFLCGQLFGQFLGTSARRRHTCAFFSRDTPNLTSHASSGSCISPRASAPTDCLAGW